MKTRTPMKRTRISYVFLVTALIAATFSFASFSQIASAAATAKEIDASADAALDRFYKQVKGADELARNAKGLLIMPNVKKPDLLSAVNMVKVP